MKKTKYFFASDERIKIKLSLSKKGDDYFILITGGRVHLGAVGYFSDGKKNSIDFPGHRDKNVIDIVISELSPYMKGNLIVAAGIHYDNITKDEIKKILEMTRKLTGKVGALL